MHLVEKKLLFNFDSIHFFAQTNTFRDNRRKIRHRAHFSLSVENDAYFPRSFTSVGWEIRKKIVEDIFIENLMENIKSPITFFRRSCGLRAKRRKRSGGHDWGWFFG